MCLFTVLTWIDRRVVFRARSWRDQVSLRLLFMDFNIIRNKSLLQDDSMLRATLWNFKFKKNTHTHTIPSIIQACASVSFTPPILRLFFFSSDTKKMFILHNIRSMSSRVNYYLFALKRGKLFIRPQSIKLLCNTFPCGRIGLHSFSPSLNFSSCFDASNDIDVRFATFNCVSHWLPEMKNGKKIRYWKRCKH